MRDITEDEIRSAFGEKTFLRGLAYFREGHVEIGVKKGDNLTGTVQGSAPHPYRVEIELRDDIHSHCTCPVGEMCKHGVALLLQWVHDRDSFVDCDHVLTSLREKNKEELITLISSMLEKDPALAAKMAFSKDTANRVNVETLSRRLRYLGRDLTYCAVPGIVEELEEMKKRGDNLAEEGRFTQALEVYLLLIEWGVDAYEDGVDDSDGELGDVVLECVESFSTGSENLSEEQKRDMIHRILKIIEREDYGLDTEEMLDGLVTAENITLIENELLRRIPTKGEKSDGEYQRERILDLLSDLHERIGMQDDALRLLMEAGFQNEEDYMRVANVLLQKDEPEEAFQCVRKGLRQQKKEKNDELGSLYFTLLKRLLLEERRNMEVDTEEMIETALQLLSFPFDSEVYSIVREVFEPMGKREELVSKVKEKKDKNVVIEVLLYENHIDEAVECALSSSTLQPSILIEVAGAAREKGMREEALKLISRAVRGGLVPLERSAIESIKFFANESDENELKEAMDHIKNLSVARILVDVLLKRNQESAVMLLGRFIADIEKEEVKRYALSLEDTYAKGICQSWVSACLGRSHVHYDDVIEILRVVRKIMHEKEWEEYISTFMRENKGKRKLMEKLGNLVQEKR